MRSLKELQDKLIPYRELSVFYNESIGYIAWREGTGNNLEILFIEGKGKELCTIMVKELIRQGKLPYNSVFAFRLGSNEIANKFYQKVGFQGVDFGKSIYRDDTTALMWVTWDAFLKHLEVTNENHS